MLQKIISALLLLVGLINFIPVIGVISSAKISQLYGVNFTSPELELLLRHRAVLLGIVGLFMMAAALVPALQLTSIAMGMASMLSFIIIMQQVGSVNPELSRVAAVDWIAIALLLFTLAIWVYANRLR